MGLFSNKDKPCPICGKATPRLLATKIQGTPICGDCSGKIKADSDLMDNWSLAELEAHLQYREENKRLFESFAATRTVDCGSDLLIDDGKKLFYIKEWTDNPPVFRFDEIISFEMLVGNHTVVSWIPGNPHTPYQPPAMGLAGSIAALADVFRKDDDDHNESRSETIQVNLRLNNPYLREIEVCNLSVYGNSIGEYERELAQEVMKANAACNIIVSMVGGAPSMVGGAVPTAPAAPSTGNVADEIMKFKNLLDVGAITQEEFDQKKKQLLGL